MGYWKVQPLNYGSSADFKPIMGLWCRCLPALWAYGADFRPHYGSDFRIMGPGTNHLTIRGCVSVTLWLLTSYSSDCHWNRHTEWLIEKYDLHQTNNSTKTCHPVPVKKIIEKSACNFHEITFFKSMKWLSEAKHQLSPVLWLDLSGLLKKFQQWEFKIRQI